MTTAVDEDCRRPHPEPLLPGSAAYRMSSTRRRRRPSDRPRPLAATTSTCIILLLPCIFAQGCLGLKQSHYVHWNSSNPIFRIDNTDHIIDVNSGNQPWEYDQVNIICPLYQRGTLPDQMETYIIYSVDKEEYDSCRIMSPNPRVIAQCTKPHELMYFTITFRSFTPTPNGMEFRPGKDYYFISTSAHGDLHRRLGGKCSTHNMKVQFKVANNNHETKTSARAPDESLSPPAPRAVNVPRPAASPSSTSATTTTETAPRRGVFGRHREKLPRYTYGDLSRQSESEDYYDYHYRPHKKAFGNRPAPHPNDVIKHEASRMAAAAAAAPLRTVAVSWRLLACLAVTRAALLLLSTL